MFHSYSEYRIKPSFVPCVWSEMWNSCSCRPNTTHEYVQVLVLANRWISPRMTPWLQVLVRSVHSTVIFTHPTYITQLHWHQLMLYRLQVTAVQTLVQYCKWTPYTNRWQKSPLSAQAACLCQPFGPLRTCVSLSGTVVGSRQCIAVYRCHLGDSPAIASLHNKSALQRGYSSSARVSVRFP